MKNPLALAFALAWAAAAAAATWLPDAGALSSLPVLFLLLALLLSRRRREWSALVCAALALSAALALRTTVRGGGFVAECQDPLPEREVLTLAGTLAEFPVIERDATRLTLATDEIRRGRRAERRRLKIAVWVPGRIDHLDRGDGLSLAASFPPRHTFANFGPDPFATARLVSGVHFSGFCKDYRLIERTSRAPLFWRAIGDWRRAIRRAIGERYPRPGGGTDAGGVFLLATVIGDRGELDPELRRTLVRSGSYHLIAISGANVGMVALFCLWLLRGLGVRRRARLLLTAVLLLCYLALSGFDPSEQRAVIMALAFFAARALSREIHPFNLLGLAGIVVLVLDPLSAIDPGFALTFGLTAAILWGRRLILPWLARLPRAGGEFLAANLSAVLASLPLSLFFFRRFAISGSLAGLLLIPMVGGVTLSGTLVMLLAPWFPGGASFVLFAVRPLLNGFLAAVAWLGGPAGLSLFRPPPSLALVIGFFVLFALAARAGPGRAKVAAIGALAALTAGLFLPPPRYRPGRLEVFFLDVGQGDAMVAVLPGGDALLIDGGGNPRSRLETGSRLILPFLIDRGIRVRWVAVSHCHPDHAAGVIELLPDLTPEEVWTGATLTGDPLYRQLRAVTPRRTRWRTVGRGFRRQEEGVTIEALAPPRPIQAEVGQNSHSLVLALADRDHRFLLTGDIAATGESALVDETPKGLAASVLKLPHHGSRGSSSEPFLDVVAPRLAVVTAGADNVYGFPHAEVLRRLADRGIPLLHTARVGAIRVGSRPGALVIEASR